MHLLSARVFSVTAVVVALAMVLSAGPAAGSSRDEAESQVATFEGTPLVLAEGWGEAQACLIWNQVGVAECFRTEEEMDRRIAELDASAAMLDELSWEGLSAASVCSTYLRLYSGTNYTGSVLYLRNRFQWLNLSAYGFSNLTSSYKVGACSSYFAENANGGGAWYPTNLTVAYAQAASMISGWNNRVSSVHIT